MCISRAPLPAFVLLLLAFPTAQARVTHDYSGTLSTNALTAVDSAGGSSRGAAFAMIYPNPFNPCMTIEVEVAQAGSAERAICDLRGRLVRVVESGSQSTGRHQATWEGQDDEGRTVTGGMESCRLCLPGGVQTQAMLLVEYD